MGLDDWTELHALQEFIADVESRLFRTATDIGANLNALLVWNELREFAELPELTFQDLEAKNPEVAEWKRIRERYEREKKASGGAEYNFPNFSDWLEEQDDELD